MATWYERTDSPELTLEAAALTSPGDGDDLDAAWEGCVSERQLERVWTDAGYFFVGRRPTIESPVLVARLAADDSGMSDGSVSTRVPNALGREVIPRTGARKRPVGSTQVPRANRLNVVTDMDQ